MKIVVVAGTKEKEEQEGPVTDWRASNADLSWQICEKTLEIQRRRRFRKGWEIQLPKKDLVETRIYQSYRMNNLCGVMSLEAPAVVTPGWTIHPGPKSQEEKAQGLHRDWVKVLEGS